MAKRSNGNKQSSTAAAAPSSSAGTSEALEQRVVAFAEQLGRIAGTVQAKAEGWMDRETLSKQIVSVRETAGELLEQLKTTVQSAASGGGSKARAKTAVASKSRGRSGGVVDAPGKKHRKPAPRDPRAVAADARASKARTGKSSMKTMKRRGRG